MIWLLAAIAAIGILTGDLQLNLYAEQKPGAVIAAAEFTTHLWGMELKSGLQNYPSKGGRANTFTVAATIPIFTPRYRTASITFTISDIEGLIVKKGQWISKGTVLAYKDPAAVEKLQESLIAYAGLQGEIQAKLEELTIRSVVAGKVQDIQIQVEEEVIKVTITILLK